VLLVLAADCMPLMRAVQTRMHGALFSAMQECMVAYFQSCMSLSKQAVSWSVVAQGKYFEAVASEINPEEKSLVACFPADTGMDECCFKLEYDILILGNIASIRVS